MWTSHNTLGVIAEHRAKRHSAQKTYPSPPSHRYRPWAFVITLRSIALTYGLSDPPVGSRRDRSRRSCRLYLASYCAYGS